MNHQHRIALKIDHRRGLTDCDDDEVRADDLNDNQGDKDAD